MKLQDFLKVSKVRCVNIGEYVYITVGKEYDVVGLDGDSVYIVNDDCEECDYLYEYFEPVLDSAENPPQGMELTPEFEVVATHASSPSNDSPHVSEPQFKAGDKVYAPSVGSKIYTVKDVGGGWCYPIRIDCSYDADHEFTKEGLITAEGLPILFLATELNHALLSQLYPHIEFERPPKVLMGSDLARALIKKGWVGFNCLCGNSGDKNAITETIVTGVNNSGQFTSIDGRLFNNAIPVIGCHPLEAREAGL